MDNLLTLNLKEEWRVLTSYFSSKKLFYLFPVVVGCVGLLIGVLAPFMRSAFDMRELLTAFILLLGVYGLLVGGFGFFADEVAQRWFGEARLLIHMYEILPISFRRLFTFFYLKDIIYYVLLTVLPLFAGAFLSFRISPHVLMKVFVSGVLSFLIGVSVTFLISSLYVRNKYTLLLIIAAVVVLYSGFHLSDFPPLSFLFYGRYVSLISGVAAFVLFSIVSLSVMNPVERANRKVFSRSPLFSRTDPLLAKELVEVRRSGTWQVVMTSYLFPLFFMYGIFYFSGRLFQMEIVIPLLFYAVFIGYLGTLVYSWLHNIDSPSFMAVLPVRTSQLIKRKIRLFLVSSLLIASFYLVVLGYLLEDMGALPVSVVTMGSTAFYVAVVTAWLCGLYPNTRLFDGSVLARYMLAILPLLIVLSILSLMREYVAVAVIAAVVFLISFVIYRDLDRKYKDMYL